MRSAASQSCAPVTPRARPCPESFRCLLLDAGGPTAACNRLLRPSSQPLIFFPPSSPVVVGSRSTLRRARTNITLQRRVQRPSASNHDREEASRNPSEITSSVSALNCYRSHASCARADFIREVQLLADVLRALQAVELLLTTKRRRGDPRVAW